VRETVVELHGPKFSSSRTGNAQRLKILSRRGPLAFTGLAINLRN
jgi:hypothetical protein